MAAKPKRGDANSALGRMLGGNAFSQRRKIKDKKRNFQTNHPTLAG